MGMNQIMSFVSCDTAGTYVVYFLDTLQNREPTVFCKKEGDVSKVQSWIQAQEAQRDVHLSTMPNVRCNPCCSV